MLGKIRVSFEFSKNIRIFFFILYFIYYLLCGCRFTRPKFFLKFSKNFALFFNAFENKDENYVKLFKQLISILVYIVNNDKDNIKNYADYAKQIVDHRDVDDKLDSKRKKKSLFILFSNFSTVSFILSRFCETF